MKKVWGLLLFLLIVTLLLVSPVAYLISYALSEQPAGQAIPSLIEQYHQSRRNPLLTALLSLLPFVLLSIVVIICQRRHVRPATLLHITLCGGLAIMLVMMWANLEYWPHFLPDTPYPGFPHGLELVIAPLFFAPVAALIGIIAGSIIGKR